MNQTYKLTDVTGRKTVAAFLSFPVGLYKHDPNWIRPLDEDIEKIFDPRKNKLLKKGEAIRWLLCNGKQQVCGRIAAFYDPVAARKNKLPTGGIGFFDCIDDQQAANILFDAAKNWLQQKGMEAMDGPVNFGSREQFWGCLADGFFQPIHNMPYNFRYYNRLFTNYGFQNYFNQYAFHISLLPGIMDPVIYEKGERVRKTEGYDFRLFAARDLEKFAGDFTTIFNEAWAKFPGVKAIHKKQAIATFKEMKPIIDPRMMIFGYYQDRPISFYLMIPDLYEITKKFNGKFTLFHKLWLLFDLKVRKVSRRAVGLIFGVVPDFQSKGVADGMILRFEEEVAKAGFQYTDLEMNWIGDFNPTMIKLVEYIGGKVRKTYITYRYLFDRNKTFERAKRLI
ncbi:MAG: hypothetical protein L3J66_05340 [Bacteroidales bacterium]|nr:hypothetical protein [Bacteroidales bacterium]